MRPLLAAALLIVTSLTAAAAEYPVVEVEVGKEVRLGGSAPVCDDPAVAWISADGAGVLHGVKEGTTICSVGLAPRRLYKVVVVRPAQDDGKGGKGNKGGEGSAR